MGTTKNLKLRIGNRELMGGWVVTAAICVCVMACALRVTALVTSTTHRFSSLARKWKIHHLMNMNLVSTYINNPVSRIMGVGPANVKAVRVVHGLDHSNVIAAIKMLKQTTFTSLACLYLSSLPPAFHEGTSCLWHFLILGFCSSVLWHAYVNIGQT